MSAVSSVDALERIAHMLCSETNFVAIFGSPEGKTNGEKVRHLKKAYRRLARLAHPDHAPAGHEALANSTFTSLKKMWEKAEVALQAGMYDEPFSAHSGNGGAHAEEDGVVIQSRTGLYHLEKDPYRTGDFSSLYRGTVIGSGTSVLVKVASDPSCNGWIETEAGILKRFTDASGTDTLFPLRGFVPNLIETFVVSGDARRSFRMNVMPFAEGYLSITDILEAFPNGLDPRDAAWISRRVIAQVLAAEMAGVVHGAVTPDHVLVHPLTHNPFHIGWAHAVGDTGSVLNRISHVLDRWRVWYPPEVFAKKEVDHRTDLFMAGKTIIKLFGGDPERNSIPKDVPQALSKIILLCVESSPARRPQNGKRVLDEFTRVVRMLWGKTYRPLTMPVRS